MSVMGEGLRPAWSHLMGLAKDAGLDIAWCAQTVERICLVAQELPGYLKSLPVRPATRKQIEAAVAANLARLT